MSAVVGLVVCKERHASKNLREEHWVVISENMVNVLAVCG